MQPAILDLAALDQRLERLLASQPELRVVAEQEADRLRALYARRPVVRLPPLPPAKVQARLRSGVPLLHDQDLYLDLSAFRLALDELLRRAAGTGDARAAGAISAAVEAGRLDLSLLAVEAFVRHDDHLSELARWAGLDEGLLVDLATRCATPLLQAYESALRPALAVEPWSRGYCPICGAWPRLIELRGPARARFLRCTDCGAGWPDRPACPFCGSAPDSGARRLFVEAGSPYGLDFCERCGGYLKASLVDEAAPGPLLALDDLASRSVDRLAQVRGLVRTPGSGFRREPGESESSLGELEL